MPAEKIRMPRKAKNSKKNVGKKKEKKDNDWERIKNTYGVKK